MDIAELGKKIAEASKTADGAELKGGKLTISETELADIYKSFMTAKGHLRDLAVGVVNSQLRIAKMGLGSSASKRALDPDKHAKAARQVAEIDCLLTTLKEAQETKPPLDAKKLYERYVAKVAAALDR